MTEIRRRRLQATVAAIALAGALPFVAAAQRTGEAVEVDAGDIGGPVAGTTGPEAGVWVIAETDDLDTGFRKIVVTDDNGRFLVPDLPEASARFQ